MSIAYLLPTALRTRLTSISAAFKKDDHFIYLHTLDKQIAPKEDALIWWAVEALCDAYIPIATTPSGRTDNDRVSEYLDPHIITED